MPNLELLPTQRGSAALNSNALAVLDAHPELADHIAMLDAGVEQLQSMQGSAFDEGQRQRQVYDDARAYRSGIIDKSQQPNGTLDPIELARADAAVERAKAAMEQKSRVTKAATTASANSRDAVGEAHAALNGLRPDDVTIVPRVPLPDGNLRDLVAAKREEMARLKAAAVDLERTPMAVEDAVSIARSSVLEGAKPIKVNVTSQRVDIELPVRRLPLISALGDNTPIEIPDVLPALATIFPDAVADAVEASVRSFYGIALAATARAWPLRLMPPLRP